MQLRKSIPLVILIAAALPAMAYAAESAAPENDGIAAEKAGKFGEAFRDYLKALERLGDQPALADDFRLREHIIKMARQLKRRPAVTDEVKREMVFGKTALEDAKNESGVKEAIVHFSKATRLAPWWGKAYFNLAVVQEKAGVFEAAANSFKLYLEADPAATDAEKVTERIYKLEYKQQEAEKVKKEGIPIDLGGTWKATAELCWRYRFAISGSELTITSYCQSPSNGSLGLYGTGTINGHHLTLRVEAGCGGIRGFGLPYTCEGEVSEDNNTIRFSNFVNGEVPACAPDQIRSWMSADAGKSFTTSLTWTREQ